MLGILEIIVLLGLLAFVLVPVVIVGVVVVAKRNQRNAIPPVVQPQKKSVD